MRRFECVEEGASKFWEVEVRGGDLWVRFGKLGTSGQEKLKALGAAAAQREADKLIAEKTKKGYVEAGDKGAAKSVKAPAAKAAGAKKPAEASAPVAKAKAATPPAAKPAQGGDDAALLAAIWAAPADPDPVRVWADFLSASDDPRGEYMQLRLLDDPTDAQAERATTLEKKLGGKLVGPARPFVDYWSWDSSGRVNFIHCDGHKLVDGWEEIRKLHPRLTVCWTTLRKQTMATVAKVSALPLPEIYFLRVESGLTDRAFAALAPSLEGVRHLSVAQNELTPAGLVAQAAHLTSLEFLCVAPAVSAYMAGTGNAICNAYAEAVAASQPLRNLRAIQFYRHGKPDAAHVKLLEKMPNMKRVVVREEPPYDADTIDRFMRGEAV